MMIEDGGLWQRQDGKQSNFGFGIYKGVFGMTRREEIERAWLGWAVQSYHRYDEKTFKEAVEWADKTMIEKATQWIETYLFDIGFPDDWCRDSATMKSGKQRFIEAMEE